jgi:hypothetical protein
MSENTKQRVYFVDENKLVIETNNGKIADAQTTTLLEGDFVIHGHDVAKLLATYSEKTLKICSVWRKGNWGVGCQFVGVDDFIDIIKKQEAELAEYRKEAAELHLAKELCSSVKKQLEHFNNTRRFYERKIDVESFFIKKLL